MIVMPVVPRVDRRRYVTKRDLVKYGYTDECQACTLLRQAGTMRRFLTMTDAETALASSWQVMTIRDKLSERCREQQLTLKMKFRVRKPEKRWTLVNHRSSHGQLVKISHDRKHSQFHVRWKKQPIPTVRVGGSAGSGTRSGVGFESK